VRDRADVGIRDGLSEKAADVRMPMGLVIARAPDAVSSGQNDAGNRRAMSAGQGHFVIANLGPGWSGRPDDRLAKQSIAGKIIDCSSPFGLFAMTVLDQSKTIEL
jgi:hypothetical protein